MRKLNLLIIPLFLVVFLIYSNMAEAAAPTWQWAKRLGGTGFDPGSSITTDSSKNVIVSGDAVGDSDVNGDGDRTDGGAESSTNYGLTDIILSKFNSSGTWQWAKRLGGTSGDNGQSVITDLNSNVITVGVVTGDADVNGDGDRTDGGAESSTGYGSKDVIVSVFNSSGTWQWAKRLGGTSDDYGYNVATDSNNNIVLTGYVNGNADVNGDGDSTDGGAESSTGYGSNDIIVSVFNSSGTWQWAKRLGGTQAESGINVAIDGNNNIAVTGNIYTAGDLNGDGDSTDGTTETASGYNVDDIFITVFNSSGTWQWAKRLGGTSYDYGLAIDTDSNNNVVITGYVNNNADVNGDGDSTDGGAESSTGYGSNDIIVSVFNSSGTWQWAKRLGGAGSENGNSVATDTSNNIFVLGYANGNVDLNGDGDSTDGGAESSTGYGSNDIIVSVFNSSGTWQWAKRLGGAGSDFGYDITLDSTDDVIMTGSVTGDADLNNDGDRTDGGAESSSNYGNSDTFITFFLQDSTAPSLSINAVTDPTTDTTPTLTGTSTDATSIVSSVEFQVDSTSGSWTNCTAVDGVFDEASETFTCTSGVLSDGSHIMYVRTTDSQSNVSSNSSDSFIVDTTSPVLSLTPITDPTGDTTPTLSGTATDASGTTALVEFQIDSTSGGWSACTADDSAFDEASETFTCTTSTLGDGSHTIYVRSTDNSSNVSSNSSDIFEIDTTLPSIQTISISTTTTSATITYSTTKAMSTQMEWGSSALYGIITTETDTSPRVTSHTITISGLLECSEYHIRILGSDSVGNTTSSSDHRLVTSGCKETVPENEPQIAKVGNDGNEGGVFTSTSDSSSNQQLITTIIEPQTFSFNAIISVRDSFIPRSDGALPNPITEILPTAKIRTNSIVAGGKILGIKSSSSISWQIGDVQEIWYKTFEKSGSTVQPAKIIPELQKKPSIVALSYTDANLIPPGRPKSKFNAKTLKLANSIDGVTWKILPTSVVDTKNRTVAALHKIGGYYMIVGR